MTIREISFVYPLLRTISLSRDLEPSRKTFLDGFLAKLKPFVDDLATKKGALIVKHGERFGDLEKFKLRTKEQNDNFKAEMRQYKSGDVNAHLNANETALFEQLLWNALLNGYEDFPEV